MLNKYVSKKPKVKENKSKERANGGHGEGALLKKGSLAAMVMTFKARGGGGVRASKNRKNYYSLNQFIF